jgi:hypothetical protein
MDSTVHERTTRIRTEGEEKEKVFIQHFPRCISFRVKVCVTMEKKKKEEESEEKSLHSLPSHVNSNLSELQRFIFELLLPLPFFLPPLLSFSSHVFGMQLHRLFDSQQSITVTASSSSLLHQATLIPACLVLIQ